MRIPRRFSQIPPRWRWTILVLAVLLVLVTVVSFLLDEPLRRTVESQMNQRLKGYTARVGKLSFHPIGFSLDLRDVVVIQDENPDPPVIRLPLLQASVQWQELIRARVVADFLLDRPTVYYNRQQLAKEAEDQISPKERGWQEALQAIYPLKINLLQVTDADVTYVDAEQARPLRLSHVAIRVGNIRNVKSREHDYPSDLHLSAHVFDSGRLAIDGHADFLAVPYMGLKANFELSGLDLSYFKPILERYHLVLRRGLVSGEGTFEVAPEIGVAEIRELTIDNADVDYVHTEATAAKEQQAPGKVHKATKEASNRPDLLLRIARANVNRSTFGLVNAANERRYRVFVTDTNLTLSNLSNQLTEGTATATLNGKFMGSGRTVVQANFRPESKGPDFDLNVRIDPTDMRTMNDIMRTYADLDVTEGTFSLYSELSVKNGAIDGYIKPLFKDLRANVPEKEDPSLGDKLKEKVVNVASKILKNRPRREVATVAEIRGPVEDPKAGTLQAVLKLVQNAFFKAILPGFEKEASRAS